MCFCAIGWFNADGSFILDKMFSTFKVLAFLANRSAIRAAFFNSIWLVLDKALRLVGGLFVGVWVARYLSPEGFGFFNTWVAFYGLILTLIGLGFDQVLLRYLVKYPSHEQRLIGSVVGLRSMLAFLTLILLSLVAFFSSFQTDIWIVIGLGTGLLFSPFLTLRQWFESRLASKYVVMSELGAFLLSATLKIVGVLYHLPVSWFVFVISIESVLGIVGYAAIYYKQRRAGRLLFDWKLARLLFSQSCPVFMSCLAIFIYTKIDQIMILALSGSHEAGIYAAAARISEILYFLPAIIVTSVFPALTILRKTDMSKYMRQLGYLFSGGALMAYVISFIILLFSPMLVTGLYGVAYAAAIPVLFIHVFSFVWITIGILSSVFIQNEKLMRYALIRDYSAVFLNVGLNFFLIPYYGAMGAAVATFIAYSFTSVWGNLFFPKLRPLFYLQVRGLRLEGLGRGLLKLKAKL
jgi:PST family polysaccharide transporter